MRIKQTRLVIAIIAFIAALMTTPLTSASSFYFTGAGSWDQGTPTTAYSEAGATWQFSFFLPGTLSSNPTTQVTNFSYVLNGTTVATSDVLAPGSGSGTVTIASAATPEPPSIILLGTALLLSAGLLRFRRTPNGPTFMDSPSLVAK